MGSRIHFSIWAAFLFLQKKTVCLKIKSFNHKNAFPVFEPVTACGNGFCASEKTATFYEHKMV